MSFKEKIAGIFIIIFVIAGFLFSFLISSERINLTKKNISRSQGEEAKNILDVQQENGQASGAETDNLTSSGDLALTEQVESLPPKVSETIRYLPKPGASWHLQLTGKIDAKREVDVYVIDLEENSPEFIGELRGRGSAVICYFSAGTWENYRQDAGSFPAEVLGATLADWPDEKWLDISRYEKFSDVMLKRMDLAVSKGCDGVDADNVDGYSNKTGFKLVYADQIKYNRWLAEEARKRGLSIGLKNDLGQVKDLVEDFDFAINEQCFKYDECDLLVPFIEQGKAVFHIEYEFRPEEFCAKSEEMGFSSLKADRSLNGENTVSCEEYLNRKTLKH